ncbi:MAG: M56 family metallopeptidase [Bacteroidales bacterium]
MALKLYFFGILFFTIRLIFSLIQLNSVVRYGSSADPALAELLKLARQQLGIQKNVRLRASKRVGSPALFGFFRPVIIVPAGMMTHLSFAEAEVILMHELIHLKRMDFLVTLIQHLLEIIFFFNPFVWFLSKTISIEREKFCDDKVIGYSNSRTTYARALFNLSLIQGNLSTLAPAATGDNKHHLLTRIQRILKIKVMKKIRIRHFYITAFAITGVVIVTTLSGFTSSLFSIDKRSHGEPVMQTGITNNHERHIRQQPEQKVESNTFDTLILQSDTLTSKQRQEMIAAMERAYKELQSIDWEEKFSEMEIEHAKMMQELPERMRIEQERIREELSRIDQEEFRIQMEKTRRKLDSTRQFMDQTEWKKQMIIEREKFEEILRNNGFSDDEMRKQLEKAYQSIENIDLDKMMADIKKSIEGMDFDFQFEFNYDSIMSGFEHSMESIHIPDIRKDIERAMEDLQTQLETLKQQGKEENLKK